MDNIKQFFSSISPQTIIIVVLTIVVAIFIYRYMWRAPAVQNPSEITTAPTAPTADSLLDKLEQSGAITKDDSNLDQT